MPLFSFNINLDDIKYIFYIPFFSMVNINLKINIKIICGTILTGLYGSILLIF